MRALAVLLLLAGSAQAQSPEMLERVIGKLAIGQPVAREAFIRPPHSLDAYRKAFGSLRPGEVAETSCRAGVPASLSISREGSPLTEQTVLASVPPVWREDWQDLRDANKRLRDAYLRWAAEAPQAIFRIRLEIVGLR